jgi:Mrp family chromosome partitioning ATPase
MGRLFEVLRQTEANLRKDDTANSGPETDDAAATENADSLVPFIEVGPRHLVEGSPDVLAAVPGRPAAAPAGEAPTLRFLSLPRATPLGPARRLAAELVALHAPTAPAAEHYRELLAAIQRAPVLHGERASALLICATCSQTSGTIVVLNLAITAAQQGRRTIVVDGNLTAPGIADALGLPPAPGLREVVMGAASLDEALRPTAQKNLVALTAGVAVTSSGARFVAETMRSLLRQLRQRADSVFIHGPVWDGGRDATVLAAAADGLCLVLPEAEAETAATDDLLQAATTQGARLAGCVLTRA